jgi:hypothetical protein
LSNRQEKTVVVHIEKVYEAFEKYFQASVRASQYARQPSRWAGIMGPARAELRAFCEKNALPIDFEER